MKFDNSGHVEIKIYTMKLPSYNTKIENEYIFHEKRHILTKFCIKIDNIVVNCQQIVRL
jgi:hypothetical protein